MKPYTKEDVKFVFMKFETLIASSREQVAVRGASRGMIDELGELEVGLFLLSDMLKKDEKEWTFDDYMSFHRVKSYLVK